MQVRRFLPTAPAFRVLLKVVRFFAGLEFDFDITLVINATEIRGWKLGDRTAEAPRLGWATWLAPQADASRGRQLEIRLPSALPPSYPANVQRAAA
jgi:predicted component of type VI protein secretion system